jgi:putative DNA primase/helicase
MIGKKVIAFPDARFKPERTFYQGRDPGGIDPNVAEFLLNVTGRDTISLGRKYKGRWQGRLPAKIVITTNETPNLADSSGVLPTRFIKLSFEKSSYDREDVHLRQTLDDELPGIATRALAALRWLNERGRFVQPAAGKAVAVAMEEQNNPLAKFCHDCLEIDNAECSMSNARLYSIFARWCEDNNAHWLRRQTPENQLVAKIRLVDGFENVQMFRPHGGKRLYNLRQKDREACWPVGVLNRMEPC